jgi:hypothetical protein
MNNYFETQKIRAQLVHELREQIEGMELPDAIVVKLLDGVTHRQFRVTLRGRVAVGPRPWKTATIQQTVKVLQAVVEGQFSFGD